MKQPIIGWAVEPIVANVKACEPIGRTDHVQAIGRPETALAPMRTEREVKALEHFNAELERLNQVVAAAMASCPYLTADQRAALFCCQPPRALTVHVFIGSDDSANGND